MKRKSTQELFDDAIIATHNVVVHRTECKLYRTGTPCLKCQGLEKERDHCTQVYYAACGVGTTAA